MTAIVTPGGARNRLTALYARGWSPATVASATGIPARACAARVDALTGAGQDTLNAISAAYERLWNQPPPRRTARERAAAKVFAAHARQAGWAPPMAWDDDQLDAPGGTPAPGWQRHDDQTRIPLQDLVEDIEWLRATGYQHATITQIAVRLRRRPDTIAKALSRHHETRQTTARPFEQEAG
ncbi:MAG: hypothetical protein ACRDNZ_08385 [Streptosporangiaceae bacterium]